MRPDGAEGPVGWNANKEKLLTLVVLSDARAEHLSPMVGEAFFRAFIVQDRLSGEVGLNFRFRYKDGKDSWFSAKPKDGHTPQEQARELREAMAEILLTAASAMGVSMSPLDIEYFDPPDDEGEWERTVQWLLDRDLVHPPKIVEG